MNDIHRYHQSLKNNISDSEIFIYSPVKQRSNSQPKHFYYPIFRTIISLISLTIIFKITHFNQKILYDVRVNRKFLHHLFFVCIVFISIYFCLLFKLRILRPENRRIAVDKWDKVAPIPMFFCSFLLVYGAVLFILGLWPAFHIMSFILLYVIYANVIYIFQWIPI